MANGMTQGDKNKMLMILLAVLVAFSAILGFMDRNPRGGTVRKERYAVDDTASVQRIVIRSDALALDNALEKNKKGWTINESHEADRNIVRVLLSVLQQVRVARPVPKVRQEEVKQQLSREGIEVQVYDDKGLMKAFYVYGNNTKTETVFAERPAGPAHIMVLPGYDSYVAGIFEVTSLDWRSRAVFSSTWRSLQRLEILYPDSPKKNVEIRFNIDFFEITGVEQIDTTAMMGFLEGLQYFEAERYIEPEDGGAYDSLLQTEPLAIVSVDDVVASRDNRVILYPALTGERVHLGLLGAEEIALFNKATVDGILKQKEDFRYVPD